jgi:4-hydroxybenzoate polyprenyltransferase
LTPPPTSDDDFPRRGKIFSTLWKKSAAVFHTVENFFPRPQNTSAWLRLLRLPNLLTVPGDVLAGFLLAPAETATGSDWAQLLLAIPAGVLLYVAGLFLNDLFDYAEDLRERPYRPLPAKHISRESAATGALVCLWIAAFLAAFFDALPVAIPLILCIILYDIGLKRIPVLGPLLMGACRAGNLLLGAAAASEGVSPAPSPIAAAIVLGLYIAILTHFARTEVRPGAKITPHHIGKLLGLLIPLQALLCVAAVHRFPANLLGLALLPFLPLHRRLATRFPPS